MAAAAFLLLLWVTIKPFVRPSPAWLPKPSVKLNWTQLLKPRRLSRIGVALEHNTNDAEILNRALGLAQSQSEPCELTLLHVVDTAMTRVLGPETADRESDADERYLADVVEALARTRLSGPPRALAWTQPRGGAGEPLATRPGRPAGRRLARARYGS